jgi:hypothetical protein
MPSSILLGSIQQLSDPSHLLPSLQIWILADYFNFSKNPTGISFQGTDENDRVPGFNANLDGIVFPQNYNILNACYPVVIL